MIDKAAVIDDLRIPPTNRLERLRSDLTGFNSIRVDAQWRIIFRGSEEGAIDVDFTDYHG